MNKLLTNISLISLLLLGMQQLTAKVQIKGNIDNALIDSVTLHIDYCHFNQEKEVLSSNINDGAFNFSFDLDRNRFVRLTYGEFYANIYLEKDSDLEVNFAYNDSTAFVPTFKGSQAPHNQFLVDFYQEFRPYFQEDSVEQKILNTSIDGLEMELFTLRRSMKKYAKEYEGSGNFSEAFTQFVDHEILYAYLYHIVGYPIVSANNNLKSSFVARIPDVLLEEVSAQVVNNEEAMISESYRNFLIYYITYKTSEINGFNKFSDYGKSLKMKFNQIRQRLSDTPYLFATTHFMYESCENADPATVQLVFKYLNSMDEDGRYASIIENRCTESLNAEIVVEKDDKKKDKNADSKGGGFIMNTLDGGTMNISELKGKVVYVDFWASWCGPCRKQFPFAKELKKKFTKKELKKVVFLYISIDDNEDSWRKAIEQYDIQGLHGWSPGGWGSKASQAFQLRSIPRYMLIDAKGNVADANAKRPSSTEIYEDIKKLLK